MKESSHAHKILGELESEIMDIVWQTPAPISVREVTELLQQKRTIAYTTVMTVMSRLATKGLLKYQEEGTTYLYRPGITREKFIARTVRTVFATVVSTLGEEAIAYFTKEIGKMSAEKRQELIHLLEEE